MKKESTQNSHMSLHFGRNEKASLKLLKQDSGRTWARLGWKNSLAKKSPPFENFSGRAHAHSSVPVAGPAAAAGHPPPASGLAVGAMMPRAATARSHNCGMSRSRARKSCGSSARQPTTP